MLTLLVDGNNHVARDWHACGSSTSAAKRFEERLQMFQEQIQPTRLVVCWDVEGTSFRKSIDPEYKSNRSSWDERLRNAVTQAKQLCIDNAVDLLEVPGFEADDLMATLCTQDVSRGWKVILSSTDKDLRQLLKANFVTQMTRWHRTRDKFAFEWNTEVAMKSRWGITPAQWLDVQILTGDRGDNIKGCEGFGDTTAMQLIKQCGSLEQLLNDPFRCTHPTKRTKLIAFKTRVPIVRQLCTLRRDVPLPASWLEEVCTR